MRELAATGFMSNRGRQNVASYVIRDWCLLMDTVEHGIQTYMPSKRSFKLRCSFLFSMPATYILMAAIFLLHGRTLAVGIWYTNYISTGDLVPLILKNYW